MSVHPKLTLGQLLLQNKVINSEQLAAALEQQQQTGELLGNILLKLGFVEDESVFLPVLASQLGVEFVNLKELSVSSDIIKRIPARFATYFKVLPIAFKDGTLTIATAHPLNVSILDGIRSIVPTKVRAALAGEKDVLEAIREYYGVGAETIDQMMGTIRIDDNLEKAVDDIEEIDSEASIGKFINQILLTAYRDRATDIHIEPFENDLTVRYRVDGVLYDAQVPANIFHFKDSINSRIKIMSNLNIAEKRLPQDGRFKVKVGDVDLDLRVSFLPTQFGESVVIRILTSNKLYDLPELGLSPQEMALLDDLIKKPHGIIFVTGPTGSGKTTTLYACLSHLNKSDCKIITIEDPIEYQLKGIVQLQVNPVIGFTFAAGLRSMLRHDPDIMMVGEVRDLETAEIAIQSALTGHLVFSTLHTNDAASGITRLVDMGIEPYLICSSVECFIAQRLVRLLCPKCKTPARISSSVAEDFGLTPAEVAGVTVYEAHGCKACNGTGYHGRESIYEFLMIKDEIRELVVARASATQIKKAAVNSGMKTLLMHGWEKVKAGITTPSEIIRVTKEDSSDIQAPSS